MPHHRKGHADSFGMTKKQGVAAFIKALRLSFHQA
jgi:hypothetical protein